MSRMFMVPMLAICLLAASGVAQTTKSGGSKPASGQVSTLPPATTPADKAPETKAPAAQKAEAPGTAVAPKDTIMTIHGVCQNPSGTPNDCSMTVTKEQFEKLVQSLNPTNQAINADMRRRLGQAYAELLAGAQAGEKAGIEKTEPYQEVMRVMRLRTLSDLYRRSLEEQLRNPPQEDIAAYYEAHKSDFDTVKLRRVYVPAMDPSGKSASAEDKAAFQKKADELSNQLRERAAKGEDTEQLQKAAYAELGISSNPPSTEMGQIRRGALPAKQDAELFKLDAGGVYKSDEPTGHVIYKVESKQTLALETVKEEISHIIYRNKLEARIKEINASVHADFNDAYFGAPTPAGTPPLARPR